MVEATPKTRQRCPCHLRVAQSQTLELSTGALVRQGGMLGLGEFPSGCASPLLFPLTQIYSRVLGREGVF